jgi:hypothetical protein
MIEVSVLQFIGIGVVLFFAAWGLARTVTYKREHKQPPTARLRRIVDAPKEKVTE